MKIIAKLGFIGRIASVAMLGALVAAGDWGNVAAAQMNAPSANGNYKVQQLELTAGKSKVLDVPTPLKRASLANPEIADTVILSPTQIYLTGKSAGVTNLTLWQEGDKVSSIIDVVVTPDVGRIKEDLHRLFPKEGGIGVSASHDRLTLSGVVSNAATLPKVLDVAESYAPKKVVNMLGVGGVQQVMLEVRVAEMSRELIKRLGINFIMNGPDSFAISLLGQLANVTQLTQAGGSLSSINLTYSQTVNAIFGFTTGSLSWQGIIDALKEENLVKVLAKPTLVAVSGQEAAFLAGGEFPIPIPQAFGVVTIQYKKFGVGLSFTPNVLDSKHIAITVAPEVSELDFQNSLRFQGFQIPAITTRRAATSIELADGQSFAIGGLLRDNVRESVKKLPYLGDLPILGALFRSTSFQKNETELLIIVTPHLIKPLDVATQALPTDFFVEPNDFELYMLGFPEKGGFGGTKGRRSPATEVVNPRILGTSKRLDGGFGHIMPERVTQ